MTDTTMIFATDPGNQTKVRLLKDPNQPGWPEFLAPTGRAEEEEERNDREGDRLFGTRIREAIRVLSKHR